MVRAEPAFDGHARSRADIQRGRGCDRNVIVQAVEVDGLVAVVVNVGGVAGNHSWIDSEEVIGGSVERPPADEPRRV